MLQESDDPLQSFHLIIPSLPGYGFSDAPKKRGFDVVEMAKIFDKLMEKLGYEKYFCQVRNFSEGKKEPEGNLNMSFLFFKKGGDWGSAISKCIGILFPKRCMGIHLNMAVSFPPPVVG